MIPTTSTMFARDIARMQHARDRGDKLSLLLLHRKIIRKYACHVSPRAQIAPTVSFPHPVGIVIGDGAVIDEGCIIFQHVTIGRSHQNCAEYPILENDCILYAGSCVLGDVHLGSKTTVGANAVVLKGKYSAGSTLVGSPAKCVWGGVLLNERVNLTNLAVAA